MQKGFLTIGHGRRPIHEFNELLRTYAVRRLVDVRSVPFSRFNPQYNQKALDQHLAGQQVSYVFMGDTLGGRPKDEASYDSKGLIDYNKLRTRPFFKAGMDRLREMLADDQLTVLMCSESDPAQCHRCKLIGAELLNEGITVNHIDKTGKLVSQHEVIARIKGEKKGGLFDAIE